MYRPVVGMDASEKPAMFFHDEKLRNALSRATSLTLHFSPLGWEKIQKKENL